MRRVSLHLRKFAANITSGNMALNPDYRELLQLLNDNGVRYLVVGGYAVALHGYPRYTKDIDIWIELERHNADRLVKTLGEFGFGSLGLTAEDFLTPDVIVQLGYPPARVDLLTTIPGVDFAACFEARIVVLLDDIHVNFIDLENLKKNKKASGRLQDLADLEHLS